MSTDLTDQLDAIQKRLHEQEPCSAHVCGSRICRTARDREFLLDLARKQQAAIDAVTALAEQWHARGEHDMKFSKTIPDEDIAMAILTDGAAKVENARHIRIALEAKP